MTPTITLFGGGAGFGLPEVSPFATKTEVQLKMAGLPFTKEQAMPDASPKGQLPFISDGGTLIADSTFIRAHIEKTYGIDLDEGLDARQRAEAWAIERMIENHFAWTTAHVRWLTPENFAKGPAMFFRELPPEMQEDLRKQIQHEIAGNIRAVGVGRHSEAEILGLGVRSLAALSALLGDQAFMMGERPTGVDAIAFGVLSGLMTPFFDAPIRDRAMRFDNLVAYVDRMMAGVYPDHRWTPLFRAPEAVAA